MGSIPTLPISLNKVITIMKSMRILNGYILVYVPNHPNCMKGGNWDGYMYEHILIAEEKIGRSLRSDEVVHHLDYNCSNNSPDNLIVLPNSSHLSLHAWLDKNIIVPKLEQAQRNELGCVRCAVCQKPILPATKYCSIKCEHEGLRKISPISKEDLHDLVWGKPTVHVAKDLGVSDVAVAKLCKKLGVDKPPRGYWAKKRSEEVTQLAG